MAKFNETISVAIIGAGVGGISLALDLQARGLNDYTIYEAEDGIGGTWYQNNYPGCRCDVPSVWYSHSRYLNPEWTETHPLRPEILKYWQDVAKSAGVDHHVKLSHRMLSAEWDADVGEYTITLLNQATGQQVITKARVLVSAIGGFHTPLVPKLKGQDKFRGKVIHCARWPKDLTPADLRGKKVAVIGNGCSGIQILSTLAADPAIELYAVARSAHWYIPAAAGGRNSAPYSEFQKSLYRNFPVAQRMLRNWIYLRSEMVWPIFKMNPISSFLRQRFQNQIEKWMRKRLPKELKDVAIPDFPCGSKRFVIEDGYFDALNSKNVTPIWGGLTGFTESGMVIDNEQVLDADIVVLSTGFDLESGNLDVQGSTTSVKDFKHISDIRLYHGMAIPGMPNYFTMLGGFSATGHASIAFILEVQANYITQLIQGIKDYKIKALDIDLKATNTWYEDVSRRAQNTVWSKAKSYMRGRGGDGKVWTHYPGFVGEIWWTNRTPEWSDYTGAESLARRQKAKRWVKRIAFVAALVVGSHYALPVELLADVHHTVREAATTVGVPGTWVETVAGALHLTTSRIDGVVAGLKSLCK